MYAHEARAEYFGDLDDFLRAFSESLSFTRDTVPELMRGYVARSPLLGEQLAECAAAMKSGRKAEISGGSLTKEEKRLVAETLASLGSRPPDAEKVRWRNAGASWAFAGNALRIHTRVRAKPR